MNDQRATAYEDAEIFCDEHELLIRHYYPWGAKRIPCSSVKGVERLPLTGASKVHRWRLWGSGDLVYWWNADAHRRKKDVALVIDVGHRVHPSITPDDPDAVERIITEHTSS